MSAEIYNILNTAILAGQFAYMYADLRVLRQLPTVKTKVNKEIMVEAVKLAEKGELSFDQTLRLMTR